MTTNPQQASDFEREKWQVDVELRRRELALKERDQENRNAEVELQRSDIAASKWRSPLVVAILAATVAAAGNAVVAYVNGNSQRGLENTRSESTRILEMIKTGDPETAARNLEFLLKAGLVTDAHLTAKLEEFLKNRAVGSGPALPAAGERVSFEKSDLLSQPLQQQLESLLGKYFTYLDGIGIPASVNPVSIKIEKLASPNAYYRLDDNSIVLDSRMATDPSVALREYSHHVLSRDRPAGAPGQYDAIESAAADYLGCSFLGNPKVGESSSRALGTPQGFIRNLRNKRSFEEFERVTANEFPYEGAEIWGGALWAIREALGQKDADSIVVTAWFGTMWPGEEDHRASAFGQALLEAARSKGARQAKVVQKVLEERGFPTAR